MFSCHVCDKLSDLCGAWCLYRDYGPPEVHLFFELRSSAASIVGYLEEKCFLK